LQRVPNASYASGADLRGRDGGGVVLLAVAWVRAPGLGRVADQYPSLYLITIVITKGSAHLGRAVLAAEQRPHPAVLCRAGARLLHLEVPAMCSTGLAQMARLGPVF
jgi:hypothetical protein